jgi:signal transduction histidine kinase
MVVSMPDGEPLARLVHDLRAPLCAIQAMVEALQDGVVKEPATLAQYYARIGGQIAQLSSMVDELSVIDPLGSAAPRPQMRPARLGDLVAEVVDATCDLARAKGVYLHAQLPSRRLPRQLMAGGDVRRAVRNLIDNAVRHTPPDGTVRVEVGSTPGYGFVSVADACGGIPEEDLTRVFEPGFRGRAAFTSEGGGGLGLAIVHAVAQAHGGAVSVHNQAPGCRFVLHLPRARPAARRQMPQQGLLKPVASPSRSPVRANVKAGPA